MKGTVAIVTGATRGLGKGIAIGLGEAGATVYITGRSLTAVPSGDATIAGSLEETCVAVEQAGGVCIPVQVDHQDDHQVKHLFDRVQQEQQGRLDLLVNNVYGGVRMLRETNGKPFWQSDIKLWDASNDAGLRSHYVASWWAAQLMTQRRQGLICTISSWGGLSYLFGAAYGAGKAACDRLAADMAVELKPYNVVSLSLWPGIVGTEHISQLAEDLATQSSANPPFSVLQERYNWETPLLTGRVIAALAADQHRMRQTGRVQIVAELARHYGLVDQDGQSPASLRSLQFLLPATFPPLRPYAQWIPDLKVPWPFLLWQALRSPQLGHLS